MREWPNPDPPSPPTTHVTRKPVNSTHADQLVADAHTRGHFGTRAVHSQLSRDGWCWPGMSKLIDATCSACHPCQQWNASRRVFHPLRAPMAAMPWDVINMDPKTSLDRDSCGMTVLLVITDLFTSFTLLRALPDKKAPTVAALYGKSLVTSALLVSFNPTTAASLLILSSKHLSRYTV